MTMLLWLACLLVAQTAELRSPDTIASAKQPADRVIITAESDLDELVTPYVNLARKTYPAAKQRFLDGLPAGSRFQVVVRLHDTITSDFEQVFVHVERIADGQIYGVVVSDVKRVSGFGLGSSFDCDEADIYDWCIVSSDGTEEGNLVGKFLDAMADRYVALVLKLTVAEDGQVISAEFSAALNKLRQDISYCIPDSVIGSAETLALTFRYTPQTAMDTAFTYVVYDMHTGVVLKQPITDGQGRTPK